MKLINLKKKPWNECKLAKLPWKDNFLKIKNHF